MIEVAGIDVVTNTALRLTLSEGRIASAAAVERAASNDRFLSPGWFDLQVNGYAGADWSDELSLEDAERLCVSLARSGTTKFLATIITGSREQMLRAVERVRRFRDASAIVRRAVAGIHVEGPFISRDEGPRGAHRPEHVRDASTDEFDSWLDASGGLVRIVTLAPECPGAARLTAHAAKRGVVVSIGHTAANAEEIVRVVDAGARMSTHLGNGLAGTIHRHENPVWPQLADPRLSAALIADGFHLPDAVLRAFVAAKHMDNIMLVSDVAAPAGLDSGRHRWSGIDVEVEASGRIALAGTPYLAGAGHLLDHGVANFRRITGASAGEAIATVTRNPHRLLGDAPQSWWLVPGAPADVVELSDSLRVLRVWVDGEEVAEEET